MKKLFTPENLLNSLLVFVPIAIVAELTHVSPLAIFVVSCLAIVPLAGLMGKATEHLSETLGQGIGGLLNATFGNAAELIIALMALREGLYEVVKASITGSIIGNILLVFGLSALLGGMKYPMQRFSPTAASMGTTMLMLSCVGLILPAIFHHLVSDSMPTVENELSLEISIVLAVTYALSLFFSLKTHRQLYTEGEMAPGVEREAPAKADGAAFGAVEPLVEGNAGEAVASLSDSAASQGPDSHPEGDATEMPKHWSRGKSIAVLLGATVAVALMSEFLVGAVEGAAQSIGMSEVFVGVILVAIIGNAAEHSTAVMMARKDKMDLSINIAVGSSIQMALFVAPLLVFLSYLVGPTPMNLLFSTLEIVAVVISVSAIALIAQDGKTNWMEGVQLLAVYLMLGMAFYLLPVGG